MKRLYTYIFALLFYIGLLSFVIPLNADIIIINRVPVATSEATCCNTLLFGTGGNDQESFECPTADDCCCSDLVVTDPDGIINTYNDSYAAPSLGTHCATITISTAGAENDNFIQVDTGTTDTDVTYGIWYYPVSVADYQGVTILSITGSSEIDNYCLFIRHLHWSTGSMKFQIQGNGDNESSSILSTGAWYFLEIEVTRNSTSTVNIYNSSMSLQDTITATAYDTNPRHLNLGCISSTTVIDHDLIYDGPKWSATGGGF